MALPSKVRQQLKAKAHSLKPIVIVGNNGLTNNVNDEIDRALNDHELIKMRINSEDRDERKALYAEISELHKAELLQMVGKIGVLYRKKPE
jgi:RNA-binding protein